MSTHRGCLHTENRQQTLGPTPFHGPLKTLLPDCHRVQLPVSSEKKKMVRETKENGESTKARVRCRCSPTWRTTVQFRRYDSFNVREKMSSLVLMAD